MPPFNIFIFPLVGGFYIINRSKLFKFNKSWRENNYLVLFYSLFAGILLLLISFSLRELLILNANETANYMYNNFILIQEEGVYLGTSLGSFFIAILFTEISNLFFKDHRILIKEILREGDPLDYMLYKSYRYDKLLLITLESNKFYIGWAYDLPIPKNLNYIHLRIAYSGYRDKKHELVFNNDYISTYNKLIEENRTEELYDYAEGIAIDVKKIQTCSLFNTELFNNFVKINNSEI